MSQAEIHCPLCTSLGMRCGICGPGKEEPTSRAALGTDELAALAEARGLRLVAAEHALDLDAARAAGAAAEREACVARLEEQRAKHRLSMVESCCLRHRLDAALAADVCFQNINAIRARSNGGAR